MQFRLQARPSPSLNITPLIDVVFLLLIFFMLSTTFVVQPGITVNLPQAVSKGVRESREVFVLITADGVLYVNDERITLQGLRAALRQALEDRTPGGDQETVVVVKADEAVKHGLVVTVMDTAKQLGAQRIAIATRPRARIP